MSPTSNPGPVLQLARHMRIHPAQAKSLPELLALRDAGGDERRICLECAHLEARSSCCLNPCRAGLARRGKNAQVGPDWVTLLQHCPGFAQRQH